MDVTGPAWLPTLLAGRVAAVTGGGGRYGLAIAAALGEAGAALELIDVDAERVMRAAEDVHALTGATVRGHALDVRDDGGLEDLVGRIAAEHGRLDVWVNAAAVLGGMPFLTYDRAALDRTLDVNLRAALVGSQLAARVMVAGGRGGGIVHVGSVGSQRAHHDAVVYDATKGALDAAARAMAVDLRPHRIRVNVVAPVRPADGARPLHELRTALATPSDDGVLRRDVADLVVFLASDLAGRITGQVIAVDDGLLATLRWRGPA